MLEINSTLTKLFYACAVIYLVQFLFNFIQRLRKLPPGPWGLPSVGYLPFIKEKYYLHMTELAEKYGPIFSFKCGQFDFVVINGWEYVKEALANDNLLARPKETFVPGVIDDASFVEMSGDPWKEQRRVALTTLRNVGFGKSSMEKKISDEVNSFIGLIKSSIDKPFNFIDSISHSVSNNISILLFGHNFDYNDPFSLNMEKLFRKTSELFKYFNVATFLPWIATLIVKLKLFNLQTMRSLFDQFESHILEEVTMHEKKGATHEIDDYIDGFLNEMRKRQNDKNTTFNINTLRRNTTAFYGAGSDTISTTLTWIMLYLIKYPEYQEKIRNEIKETIGFESQPEGSDRPKMPLTLAFIYEAQRVSSIVPLNLLRRATADINIGNQTIPKDSLVALNFWSVHFDPNLWDEPKLFKPDRFLNEDGSKVIKPPYLIPFSGGRRVCPGESLANLEIFLYLVSILQNFQVSAAKDENVSLEDKNLFIRKPKTSIRLVFKTID